MSLPGVKCISNAITSRKLIQTQKRLRENFLTRRNGKKGTHFRGSPLFQATYKKPPKTTQNNKKQKQKQHTQKKQTNNRKHLTYFLSVGCGRLAEGKGHETDPRKLQQGAISGQPMPFQCTGICVLRPTHECEMRGSLVYLLIVKDLCLGFCLN